LKRTLFVGDDTGLLKTLSMKLSYDSITISEPSLPPKKHRKRKEGEEEVLDEIGEEVK